jgi:hypothetical protein
LIDLSLLIEFISFCIADADSYLMFDNDLISCADKESFLKLPLNEQKKSSSFSK